MITLHLPQDVAIPEVLVYLTHWPTYLTQNFHKVIPWSYKNYSK